MRLRARGSALARRAGRRGAVRRVRAVDRLDDGPPRRGRCRRDRGAAPAMLAAANGGPIVTVERTLRPAQATVSLRLVAERQDPVGLRTAGRGAGDPAGRGDSIAAAAVRAIGRVFARELSI
ncbi:hypothetical protein AB5I41_07960 [Sphingomonas sp. MMS24-JH45]